MVIFAYVACLAQAFGVVQAISVLTFHGFFVPTKPVVALVAHALGKVLQMGMWASSDLARGAPEFVLSGFWNRHVIISDDLLLLRLW